MQPQQGSSDRLATLAWEIAHCPYFRGFERGEAGVCTEVIQAQGTFRRSPEGWTGRILEAPILFVTSNPNTDITVAGHDPSFSSGYEVALFNDQYFDSHSTTGARTWIQMQEWATEMLDGRSARPGIDFALTDAVRCASPRQIGVDKALSRCSGLYLGRLLSLSKARVIAFCGKAVVALRDFVEPASNRLTLRLGSVSGPRDFFGIERCLVALRHPADYYHGSLRLNTLKPDVLAILISALKSTAT